eukprot:6523942-Alexandrium_andersonii.AAC.1
MVGVGGARAGVVLVGSLGSGLKAGTGGALGPARAGSAGCAGPRAPSGSTGPRRNTMGMISVRTRV